MLSVLPDAGPWVSFASLPLPSTTIVTVVRAEAVSGAGNLVTKGAWDIVKAPAARGRSAPVVLCVAVSANLRKSRATVQIRGARSLR